MLDFSTELVSGQQELSTLIARLGDAPAMALDIETVNWWDRAAERVALVQLAFREGGGVRVAVIDALAGLDFEALRAPLEESAATKAIHNASYDAVRLARHFNIHTSPIHDTMLVARRGGERRYSLQALAQARLGVSLDKSEQRGDWARRPMSAAQLRYAALDAACTLLLYEDQIGRGLFGAYRLREDARRLQTALPLGDVSGRAHGLADEQTFAYTTAEAPENLRPQAFALLGVLTELTGRYGPERLAVSAGSERVGLAGWIIDRVLGPEADLDEDTVKLEIAELCERGFARLDDARRLEATEAGALLWRRLKPS